MKRRDFTIGASLGALTSGAGTASAGELGFGPLRGNVAAVEDAWRRASTGQVPAIGRSDAFLVVQDGRIVFERYGADHGPMTRHISWSMAKSITHALVGIGVGDGLVDIDRPLSLLRNPDPGLTLRRLLNLTDGLAWNEESYSPEDSDATRLLYGAGRLDGAAFTAAQRQVARPGARFNYSTGSFHLAAAELAAHLFPHATTPVEKRQLMADWIRRRLFGPLGMATALAEFDAAGVFVGGSYVYASARDYAKFGELYRLDGVVQGRRVLPEGWVRFARTPTVCPVYGAGFWLEYPGRSPLTQPSQLLWHGPYDAFSAQGHQGQVILIIPSMKTVIVRLGLADDTPPTWIGLRGWLSDVTAALAV